MSRGLEDLLRRFSGAEPELALLLVKAPIGPVVSGLADAYGMMPLLEDATVKVATHGELQASGWMAAVQLRDEPWMCVYVAVEEVTGLDQELVRQVAVDLSDTLSTDSIALLIGSELLDTGEPGAESEEGSASGPKVSFELFTDGETVDHARWQIDGPLEIFECELREPPEDSASVPMDLINDLTGDRGIFVPSCCTRSRGEQGWLELWDLDPHRLLRADLFRLRGSSFFDDETLELTLDEVPVATSDEEQQIQEPIDSAEELPDTAKERENPEPASVGGLRGIFRRLIGRG